jgi:hypothetical protein
MSNEPRVVQEARLTIREWELRNGHNSYTQPLDSGYRGYQARCWDCDWRGTEYLRGDEEMGTPESRAHKKNAHREAAEHSQVTQTGRWVGHSADTRDFSVLAMERNSDH